MMSMTTATAAVVVPSANNLTSKTNNHQLLIISSISNVSYYSTTANSRRRRLIETQQRCCCCSSSPSSSSSGGGVITSFYEVLGISERTSCYSDIKKAYKEMARKYHPNVAPPEKVDEYTRMFISVREAYQTLSDPQSRALYDRGLSADFNFSSSHRHREEDQTARWQSQLDGLQRRRQTSSRSRGDIMSWGARMRSQTQRRPTSSW